MMTNMRLEQKYLKKLQRENLHSVDLYKTKTNSTVRSLDSVFRIAFLLLQFQWLTSRSKGEKLTEQNSRTKEKKHCRSLKSYIITNMLDIIREKIFENNFYFLGSLSILGCGRLRMKVSLLRTLIRSSSN
jgi:hypothetical protein